MIEEVQDKIEIGGFHQIITGITRSLRTHEDSLLDHVWVNCPLRIISHGNSPNGSSDHNVIDVSISMHDLKIGGVNRRGRTWKEFNGQRCQRSLEAINWEDVYSESNPDLANDKLEVFWFVLSI